MRAETRKKYIAILMAAVLVLTVPLVWVRAIFAANELTIHDFNAVPQWKIAVTTRNGDVLFRETCSAPEVFGNLIGNPNESKAGNAITNSVTNRYADKLIPHSLNPITGLSSMTEDTNERLETTLLSEAAHRSVQDAFDSHNGVCAAYNYITGEVYMLLSLPSGISTAADAPAGSLINLCTQGRVVPGSTMKPLGAVCAMDQGLDPNFTFTCTGTLTLPDNKVIKCHKASGHGNLDLEGAIGLSCNVYMAALIQQLDVEQAVATLEKMNFLMNDEKVLSEENPISTGHISALTYPYSRTTFTSNQEFTSVWGLIGQGMSNVNPMHMLTIAGAIANGGQAATPYLVERIISGDDIYLQAKKSENLTLIDGQTAEKVAEIWRNATEKHYKADDRFTMLKTGTAETTGATNRLLMGVIEDCHTVFYICVNGSTGSEIYDIANSLLEALPRSGA